jgi:putative ABC transport system ATP-binding protein
MAADTSRHTPDGLADLRARTIGFIFQTFNLFPVLSAEENIEYPLPANARALQATSEALASKFLDVVQLSKFGRHRPSELSGGQRQRVAIARALATRPKIILADEPTANLDSRTGAGILELMKEINRSFQTTFVFSTHDKKVIAKADRLVRIEDGRVRRLGMRTADGWVLVKERRRTRSAEAGLTEEAEK